MRELLHQRTPLFHEDFPLILLWSEKSGCTTLLKWFFYQLGLLDDALKHSDWVHDYENQVFKARDDYLLDLDRALDKQEKPVVKLVRDPYQRALSSYLSLTEKKDGEEHWSIEVRRHVRNYFYGTVGGPYGFSYRQYLQWLQETGVDECDGHIAPQRSPLEDHISGVQILKLEEFSDRIRSLEAAHGLKESDLEAISESAHHVKKATLEGARQGAVAEIQIPMPRPDWYPVPSSRNFYTQECADRVRSIFEGGFESYGYPELSL